MGSYQIWPSHVTQAKNLSFPYLKSYCPLNFMVFQGIQFTIYLGKSLIVYDKLYERFIPSAHSPPKQELRVNRKADLQAIGGKLILCH